MNLSLKPLALIASLLFTTSAFAEDNSYPHLDVLISTTTSVIGQKLEYPSGKAKVTAAIVTMQPGESTGLHKHNVPLFAYILEGELSVDYGADGTNVYKAGDSFIEAFLTEHNGTNTGDTIVRIIAVFAGATDIQNTVEAE